MKNENLVTETAIITLKRLEEKLIELEEKHFIFFQDYLKQNNLEKITIKQYGHIVYILSNNTLSSILNDYFTEEEIFELNELKIIFNSISNSYTKLNLILDQKNYNYDDKKLQRKNDKKFDDIEEYIATLQIKLIKKVLQRLYHETRILEEEQTISEWISEQSIDEIMQPILHYVNNESNYNDGYLSIISDIKDGYRSNFGRIILDGFYIKITKDILYEIKNNPSYMLNNIFDDLKNKAELET